MKQLKDLTQEGLQALYKNNHDFQEALDNNAYEMNMQAQYEEGVAIFGEKNDTYEMHNHYSSFYLTVRDAERFVDSIKDPDYLTEDNRKLYEETPRNGRKMGQYGL